MQRRVLILLAVQVGRVCVFMFCEVGYTMHSLLYMFSVLQFGLCYKLQM